jgi:Na+/proline symporter
MHAKEIHTLLSIFILTFSSLRLFDVVASTGTLFATVFSGYTVVGVPNESFFLGFFSFRWMAATASFIASIIGTGMRLRKASLIRNHQSPVDFISDRFQCNYLRYTIVFIQTLSCVLYLSAQVVALKVTVNSMLGFDPSVDWPVMILFGIIVAFEWAGGLSSVALADYIQAMIMIVAFVLLPIVIKQNFGGWSALDPSTFPRPSFYQTPTKQEQWLSWQFSFLLVAGFCYPHSIQRVYAARDLKSLRTAWIFLAISPWFTVFVSIFVGTMGVQMLSDAGISNPVSPFSSILGVIIDIGGFAKAVGIIAFTATVAAVMSTTDSLINAASQLIVVEVIYPCCPEADPFTIAWSGRLVSLVYTSLGLLLGLLWTGGINDLAAINFPVIMQAVPTFLVGLYTVNDTWDVHPWSLATAALLSTIFVFLIYFLYIDTTEFWAISTMDPLPINAGMTGLTVNIIFVCMFEAIYRCFLRKKPMDHGKKRDDVTLNTSSRGNLAKRGTEQANAASDDDDAGFSRADMNNGANSNEREQLDRRQRMHPNRPCWDIPKLARFGQRPLTPRLLNRMMEGIPEPFSNWWHILVFFLAVTVSTPLLAELEPALNEDGQTFDSPPQTVNGLPWWVFKEIIMIMIPYILLGMTLWHMPSKFQFDNRTMTKSGVDLDLIEMTPTEMGRRKSYDEPNRLFNARQFTIRKYMFNLGIHEAVDEEADADDEHVSRRDEPVVSPQLQRSSEAAAEVETRPNYLAESRMKLSALILGENSADINNIMEELYDGESSVQENNFGVQSASI